MGNNNSNEKEEQIIIQAAGMGSNEAKETAEITRSEWLLITLIVLAVVVVIYLSLKKLIKSIQKNDKYGDSTTEYSGFSSQYQQYGSTSVVCDMFSECSNAMRRRVGSAKQRIKDI